jgi:glucose dehydrogenase
MAGARSAVASGSTDDAAATSPTAGLDCAARSYLGRGDQRLAALAASRGALPASFSDQS